MMLSLEIGCHMSPRINRRHPIITDRKGFGTRIDNAEGLRVLPFDPDPSSEPNV